MEETTNAINENKIVALCTQISNYYDKISNVFDQIDFEMKDLKDYINGPSYNIILNNYNLIRNDFSKIKQGINNYSDDYACLVRKMKEDSNYILRLFENYTRELQSNTKQVK